MSEPSSEAVVAAEAAGNAVEELHDREAVHETAHAAHETAAQAQDTASLAVQQASEAQSTALEVAEHASREAEHTREAVNEAVAGLADGTVSREEFENFRSQMDPLLQHYARLEAERIANEQREAENTVSEVDVQDGIGSGSSTSSDGSGTPGGTGNSDSGRDGAVRRSSGLRHRRRG